MLRRFRSVAITTTVASLLALFGVPSLASASSPPDCNHLGCTYNGGGGGSGGSPISGVGSGGGGHGGGGNNGGEGGGGSFQPLNWTHSKRLE